MQRIDPHSWCFLSGWIAALENNLLREETLEHLLLLEKPEEILACLKESPLREEFFTPEDVMNYEEILDYRFFRTLQEVKEFSPSLKVWELIQARYNLINLKNFLKEKLIGLKRPIPFPSPYTDETWQSLWQGIEYYPSGLPALPFEAEPTVQTYTPKLTVWQSGMYQDALVILKKHLGEISINPGVLDLILDGTYLSYLPGMAGKTLCQFIVEYYLEYQKLVGILYLWRSGIKNIQEYLPQPLLITGMPVSEKIVEMDWERLLKEVLPWEMVSKIEAAAELSQPKERTPLARYGKVVEDTLMERLVKARYFVFGPERIFGYLKALEVETCNLRLVIGGRLNSVPPEDIRRRIRRGYV